jgi:hypothetical protein
MIDVQTGNQIYELMAGKGVIFRLFFDKKEDITYQHFHVAIGIHDQFGMVLANINTSLKDGDFLNLQSDEKHVDILINKFPLNAGLYNLTLFARIAGDITDWVSNAFEFSVGEGNYFNTGRTFDRGHGTFFIDHTFILNSTF